MKLLLGTLLIGLLVACGGGGGGTTAPTPTGPITSTSSFPLRQGINKLTANGEVLSMTATGTSTTQMTDGNCSGNLLSTSAPVVGSATFQGQPALSAAFAISISFTNCTPASLAESGTYYYDSNYAPLGSINASSGKMNLWQPAPNIPTTVRVGDVVIVGTEKYFTNTSATVSDGRSENTLMVEADTSTTAILNKIVKIYNAAGQLTSTTQERSRIDTTGAITRISTDIQYSNISTLRLVFRR
jgi:hypothetical protein